MRNYESKCSLTERIKQLDLSAADRRVALQDAARARWVADVLQGLTTGVVKLADVAIGTPVRRVVAWLA